MEIIIIIIVVVIISLLSAANKKKPRQDSEDTPARPTLSDIQRAFMMSNEMDQAPRRAPETRQVSSFSQPAQQTAAGQDDVSSRMAKSASAFQASNQYASIDLAKFHTDNTDVVGAAPKKSAMHQKSALKLFENKSDFVRAVIYSEILTRKSR